MRLTTYLIGLLILANIMVYFWPDRLNTGAKLYAAKSDVKPHFLRLNKEIEDKYYAKRKVDKLVAESAFTAPSSGADVLGVPKDNKLAAPILTAADGRDCYRLGPFLNAPNYELAQTVLLSADINYKKTKRVAKESNVYRVYLGPFSDSVTLAAARTELNSKKVFDHFVRKEPSGQFVISLGIYSSKLKAAEAVGLFNGQLDTVNQRNETITLPDSFWLHFEVSADDLVRSKLTQTDWGEKSAKIGRFRCLG